jgi:hypothetical protein
MLPGKADLVTVSAFVPARQGRNAETVLYRGYSCPGREVALFELGLRLRRAGSEEVFIEIVRAEET